MDGSGIVLNAWGSILWWAIPLLIAWFVFDSAWFKGKVGEWAVNRSFDKHLDPDEYKVLHDVTLPFKGGTTQIDHIVLSQFGVFVVETKVSSQEIQIPKPPSTKCKTRKGGNQSIETSTRGRAVGSHFYRDGALQDRNA
jgi:hypothetical protein